MDEDITTKNPEAKLYADPKELKSEPKFEESVAERTKMRRQKSDEKRQEGQGLKILSPNQMLSRLPITLAQLESGHNAEKLKNVIRRLLYSLHRSKKLTETNYNNLINTI